MSIVGTYSGGSASANEYSTFQELLGQLPDNTANLIQAVDIRDSIYTLWRKFEDVQITASAAGSASSFFNNSNQVPITVGGIVAGYTFSTNYTMQQMWNLLLYPYISPSDSISPLSNRQYGAPLLTSLSWSVVKNTNNIVSVVVDGFSQVVTGNSQTGVQATNATYSTSPSISQVNIFTMSVSDGTSTSYATNSLTWMNKRYWGRVNLITVGNPDLTLNPGSASSVGSYISDSIIQLLNGASANGVLYGSELSTSISKTYNGIDGQGRYLIFAHPTSFGTPTFLVNGMYNNAFTKVRSNSSFINEYSFAGTNYDVWVSNTLQNSPLNIIIS